MAKKNEAAWRYAAQLDRVIDGDTVDAMIDLGFSTHRKIRIRFYGIDTWESRTRDLEVKKKGLAGSLRGPLIWRREVRQVLGRVVHRVPWRDQRPANAHKRGAWQGVLRWKTLTNANPTPKQTPNYGPTAPQGVGSGAPVAETSGQSRTTTNANARRRKYHE